MHPSIFAQCPLYCVQIVAGWVAEWEADGTADPGWQTHTDHLRAPKPPPVSAPLKSLMSKKGPSAAWSSSFAFRHHQPAVNFPAAVSCNIPRGPQVQHSNSGFKQLGDPVLWVQGLLGHCWSSGVGQAVNPDFPVFFTGTFQNSVPKFSGMFLNQALNWYSVFIWTVTSWKTIL